MQNFPEMGLVGWNLLSDDFDHTQLLANWAKLNLHDHTPGKGQLIPTAGLANLAVTTAKLADDAVTNAKIAINAVGAAQIASNAVTTFKIAGNAVATASIADGAVTDAKLATRIVRGVINAAGTTVRGTGFSVSKPGTGQYVITYTVPFTANPIGVVSIHSGGDKMSYIDDGFTTRLEVYTQDISAGPQDMDFSFIVVSA